MVWALGWLTGLLQYNINSLQNIRMTRTQCAMRKGMGTIQRVSEVYVKCKWRKGA